MMPIAQTMRVVEIQQPGGPEVLVIAQRPVPTPAAGEVLIHVQAAGVNRPDVIQRQGHYPPPPGASDIPGLEVAGTIAALGEGVNGWAVGDTVCALLAGGGYADYATAPAVQCLPIPQGLSLEEAAALPETVFTVWSNVFERGGLQPGESLLVHGGTSGIGSIAIQLAKALGSTVYATAGGHDKARACEKLGADRGIDYRAEDFVAVIKELTGKRGVDVVLDMVGGDYLPRNIDCLAPDGRHVTIAFLHGPKAEINLAPVMLKRLTLTGSTLRARPVAQKAALAAAVQNHVWPLVAAGRVRPVIHARFPLEQAASAHRLMEASSHIGKIVLVP
jgi:putative PIG3 family NAD(P)H quinone oxidoreductase